MDGLTECREDGVGNAEVGSIRELIPYLIMPASVSPPFYGRMWEK